MFESMSDTELMVCASEGDMEAYRVLIERYSERIHGFLIRFIRDRERALDLAQDTFLRLFRRIRERGSEDLGTGSCKSLIFTIAANLGRDELRKRGVRKEISMPEDYEFHASANPGPDELAVRREESERAQIALDSLPDETRELLVLREVQGMSYEHISGVMRLNVGTVKSRIHRARVAFKDAYFKL